MGRRGPAPKPTALRVLQGNPGKIPLNPHEPHPKPAASNLQPPSFLRKDGLDAWKRLAPQLLAVGLLTEVDTDVFAAYCANYARWREAENFLQVNGLMFGVRDFTGINKNDEKAKLSAPVKYLQQYPQVSIAQKALLMMCKLGAELGLTPASRSRIHIPDGSEADSSEKLMFGS